MTVDINIDMNRKCAECSKPGAVDNGLCLPCTTKAIMGKTMKSSNGKAVQARMGRLRTRTMER